MKKFKFIRGFTLIELLVVIAIIGILGAIVYAPFQTARSKGRDAKKVSEMKSIQTDLSLYQDAHGQYPKSLTDLQGSQEDQLPSDANLTTSYLPNKYNYTSYQDASGNVLGYHLYVHLETMSGALQGAAKCRAGSASLSAASTTCLISDAYSAPGGTTEPNQGVSGVTVADFTIHTADSDKNCAKNVAACIFDIRG